MAKTASDERPGEKTKDRVTSRFRLDVKQVKTQSGFEDKVIGYIGWHDQVLSYQVAGDRILLGVDAELDSIPLVKDQREVPLEKTPCHFGGVRYWFRCPSCDERVGTLFLNKGAFECRTCCELAYPSQLECRTSRLIGKAMRIRRRLRDNGDFFAPRPEKPKGMHYQTYWRCLLELRKTEEEVSRAMLKMMFPDREDWNELSPSVKQAFDEYDALHGLDIAEDD